MYSFTRWPLVFNSIGQLMGLHAVKKIEAVRSTTVIGLRSDNFHFFVEIIGQLRFFFEKLDNFDFNLTFSYLKKNNFK